jgi:hypothetical protein
MSVVQSVNLALAFLLELCGLAALADWGFHTGWGTPIAVALGVGAPLLAAVVWGMLAAPRARVHAPMAVRTAVKVSFFTLATAGLTAAGHLTLACAFALLVLLNAALLYVGDH